MKKKKVVVKMKKRKVLKSFVTIVVCTILSGCGETTHVPQETKILEDVTAQDKFDETVFSEIENKDVETETNMAVTEPEIDANVAETVMNENSLESVYQNLLDGIYDLILSEDKETDMELAAQAFNGILEAGYSKEPEETLECVGYTFLDVNADEIPELVIGGINEERDEKFLGRDIYAIYTCVQEEIYCICSGWSRSYVGWLGENVFYQLGSGGASYTTIGQYELLPNDKEWSCIDFYFTDENGIYYNQTGVHDKEYAETLDMTWDEFWEINDELYDNVLEFELTPFSNYTYFGDFQRQNNDTGVTVQWAEDVLSTIADYDEYIAYSGEYSARVAFTTEDSVEDFKVLALQYESMDEEGNIQFSTTELYDYGILVSDRVLVVEMIFEGTIPGYGISYMDEQGNTKVFSVNISGYDGSLLLQEVVQTE